MSFWEGVKRTVKNTIEVGKEVVSKDKADGETRTVLSRGIDFIMLTQQKTIQDIAGLISAEEPEVDHFNRAKHARLCESLRQEKILLEEKRATATRTLDTARNGALAALKLAGVDVPSVDELGPREDEFRAQLAKALAESLTGVRQAEEQVRLAGPKSSRALVLGEKVKEMERAADRARKALASFEDIRRCAGAVTQSDQDHRFALESLASALCVDEDGIRRALLMLDQQEGFDSLKDCLRGYLAYLDEDYAGAARLMEGYIDEIPHSFLLNKAYAASLNRTARGAGAVVYCERVVERVPDDLEIHGILRDVHLQVGDEQAAAIEASICALLESGDTADAGSRRS